MQTKPLWAAVIDLVGGMIICATIVVLALSITSTRQEVHDTADQCTELRQRLDTLVLAGVVQERIKKPETPVGSAEE